MKPSQSISSGIKDNHSRGTVGEFLKANINDGSRLSVVSAFFTIYAYDALKDHLGRIEHMDFLFGEPRFIRSLDPDKTEKKAFVIDSSRLKRFTSLDHENRVPQQNLWLIFGSGSLPSV
jgi:hypothetical protein